MSIRGSLLSGWSFLALPLGYFRRTESTPWLMMPWLLVSPGHQQLWDWPCRMIWFLSPGWRMSVPVRSPCIKFIQNANIYFHVPSNYLRTLRVYIKKKSHYPSCYLPSIDDYIIEFYLLAHKQSRIGLIQINILLVTVKYDGSMPIPSNTAIDYESGLNDMQ